MFILRKRGNKSTPSSGTLRVDVEHYMLGMHQGFLFCRILWAGMDLIGQVRCNQESCAIFRPKNASFVKWNGPRELCLGRIGRTDPRDGVHFQASPGTSPEDLSSMLHHAKLAWGSDSASFPPSLVIIAFALSIPGGRVPCRRQFSPRTVVQHYVRHSFIPLDPHRYILRRYSAEGRKWVSRHFETHSRSSPLSTRGISSAPPVSPGCFPPSNERVGRGARGRRGAHFLSSLSGSEVVAT